MSNAIDGLIRKYRRSSDTPPDIPDEWLARLEVASNTMRPSSPRDRWRWIFDDWHPDLPVPRDDFDAYTSAINDSRVVAIREILQEDGLDSVTRLAMEVKLPWAVGAALASVVTADEVRAVLQRLESPEPRLVQFADSFARFHLRQDASLVRPWIDEFADHPRVRARLLLTIADVEVAWRIAESLGGEAENIYWAEFEPHGRGQGYCVAVRVLVAARH